MPAAAAQSAPRHLPQLDGLRGVAILLVLSAHTWRDFPSLPLAWLGRAGWAGVDLFFVLSGFLITRILLEARGSPRYYLNFYGRRGLRIWPLYYLVLAFVFVANARWGFLEPAPPHSFWRYALYLQNFIYGTAATMPLAITWSLAIEEHFYLLWPAVVARVSRNALAKLLVAVILGEAVFRFFFLPRLGDSTWTIYRADELAMGALLACWGKSSTTKDTKAHEGKTRKKNFATLRLRSGQALSTENAEKNNRENQGLAWLATTILPLSFAAILHYPAQHWILRHGILCSTLAIGFAGLMGIAIAPVTATANQRSLSGAPQVLLRRALENRFLRFTGKISYGMYLYHAIIVPMFEGSRLRAQLAAVPSPWLRDGTMLLVEWGMVYAVATFSWYALEQPILGLKRYFGSDASGIISASRIQSRHARILEAMELIVYSAPWCRDCREAKRFLTEHSIPFTEIDIESTPGAAEEVVRRTGKRAIPQFVIDGEWVQPYRPGEGFLYDEMSKRLGVEHS